MNDATNETATSERRPYVRRALREELREDDPRARAKARANAIKGHIGDLDEGTDEFRIDPDVIPDGWRYNWKRKTVLDKEDPSYDVSLARNGWEPVPASRHPEMMPSGAKAETIMRKGMILMEIPEEIAQERQAIAMREARRQVRSKEEQLSAAPDGQFDRNLSKVSKKIAPVEIPE